MNPLVQNPQVDLRDLVRLVTDPELWACLGPALTLMLLFAVSVVRRRHPSPGVLLALGLILGELASALARPSHVSALDAMIIGLGLGAGLWPLLALSVLMAAVIQPGEPAPISLTRTARHLGPAVVGSMLLLAYEDEVGWLGLPVALVTLGATRPSPRVDHVWRTAALLVGCHVATFLGALLVATFFDESALFPLVLEGWLGLQAAAALLEVRQRGPVRWLLVWALLLGLGGLGALWAMPVQAQIAWHAMGRRLPRCAGIPYGFSDHVEVWSSRALPDDFLVPDPAWDKPHEPPILVTDADEPLNRLLGRPFQVACLARDSRRYGVAALLGGPGVEVRWSEQGAVLATGQPASPQALREAAQRCRIPDMASPRGEGWTAQAVAAQCSGGRFCARGAQLCTFSPEKGWHLQ